MPEIHINLDTKIADNDPLQGVNRGDTVSWNSNRLNGKVEVKFFRFEPADIHPFKQPPKLRNNIVSEDAPRGRYFYRVLNNGDDIGGGTIETPDPPDTP